jgi:hypothetical protein
MTLTKTNIPKHRYPTLDVASIKRIVESRHGVTACLCNLLHLGKLVCATGGKVEEGKLVEVLCLLVCFFDNLITVSIARVVMQEVSNELCDYPASKLAGPISTSIPGD